MNKTIDCTPVVEEVMEFFKQQIFPDEEAVVVYKLRHRYEPRLAHEMFTDYRVLGIGEMVSTAIDFNCIRVPYDDLGELRHSESLIVDCWDRIFDLPGRIYHGNRWKRSFVYKEVLFFRRIRRRIDYVPEGKIWKYML